MIELDQRKMRQFLRRDEDGKIILRTKDGGIARFTHAVDAREALSVKDPETGEQMFFMPEASRERTVVRKEASIPEKEEDEDVEVTEPKTTSKKFKKISTSRGRPKRSSAADEAEQSDEEDEEKEE